MPHDESQRDDAQHAWEAGYDGHERAQRRRLAELTLEQKLEWLEEAQRVAEQLQRSRRHREAGGV